MKMNFGNKSGYLDPGTGNALFAALFGILGSIAYFVKDIFYKITGKKHEIFKSDIAIFSEGKMYWIYFKDIVEELIKRKIKFAYYTMDMNDPALELYDYGNPEADFSLFNVKFVGTGNKGYSAISNLKEKNILSTTPNIGCPGYPIKKPKNCENLIHIFHSLGLGYKKGGLDNYDTILLHQNHYGKLFESKKVILAGLPYLDSLIERAKNLQNNTDGKTILIASTWGDRGVLKTYGFKFILDLASAGYNVIVRPHPYSYIYEKEFIENMQKELPNIPFNTEIDSLAVLSKADILISDISGVRFDFFLAFNRPVISLESGSNYGYEHDEWLVRISEDIGAFVKKEEIGNLPQIAKNIAKRKLIDKSSILANIGNSKITSANYLAGLNAVNLYANTAYLYDFDNRDLLNYDLELCLKYVSETCGDILEIACGTGRVTIPILKNAPNRKVTAFDLSEEMLSVFRKKINPSIYNLQLANANMKDFNFKQKFGLVILIWRAFQVLLKEEDAIKCLHNINKHMASDAVFLFSIFLPQKSYGIDWLGEKTVAYEIVDPATGNKIKRSTKNLSSDEEKQIIEYASIYDIITPEGKCETLEDRIIYRYYYPEQIKRLLINCGFTVLKEHNTSTDLFFALKKAT